MEPEFFESGSRSRNYLINKYIDMFNKYIDMFLQL